MRIIKSSTSVSTSMASGKRVDSGRVYRIFREETEALHLKWRLAGGLAAMIPSGTGLRARPRIYRLAGVSVGARTVIAGSVHISGSGRPSQRLRIGSDCFINEGVWFNLGDDVTIEDGVAIGMECLVLTVTHELSGPSSRAGSTTTKPVSIQRGAWLGARVTLLPGVTVGFGSVIAAGSVVTTSIPPNVLAGGVPARVIRDLPGVRVGD